MCVTHQYKIDACIENCQVISLSYLEISH